MCEVIIEDKIRNNYITKGNIGVASIVGQMRENSLGNEERWFIKPLWVFFYKNKG